MPGAPAALEAAGIPPLPALVLSARGLDTPEKARAFLSCDPSSLSDPFLLKDMDAAAARIRAALDRGETIAVYGDYDVDGITATALLTDYLRSQGASVIPYIPDRLEEGYGLNTEAVSALRGQGVTLIITVDCGITAVEETAWARSLGVDVVITDHHECKDILPAAAAVVDPHRSDCPYPFKHLAGVGVALKLVLALGAPEERETLLSRYCDLAAVGTVADVMRMSGENRAIVSLGLRALRTDPRPGFRALLREAGLTGRPLTSVSLGYTLAPRINASGRMGRASLAGELLLTENGERAETLSRELCELNRERQAIEGEIFAECISLAETIPPEKRTVLVLSGEHWHQGVVGIVASRLSEKYSCPTFMICLQDGKGKGSCRSFAGFNLFAALESCQDLLEGFGGHALAAGFTIREENVAPFRARMEELVALATGGSPMTACLDIDAQVDDPALLSLENVESLSILEPCGAGNPRPVLSLCGCTILAMSEVGGGKHLKLKVSFRGESFDAIFFSTTAADTGLSPGDRADLAFYPQINEYRGWRSVQLQLIALRPALTRAQSERALYEKFRSGDVLTPQEAAALIPSRDEFAALWRYLRDRGEEQRLEETVRHLSRNVARAGGVRESFMRTMVCLEVFDERGLIQVERSCDHLRISLLPRQDKVKLEESYILQRLHKLLGP